MSPSSAHRRSLHRRVAAGAAIAVTAAALAPAVASARPDQGRGHGHDKDHGARLLARAILSADFQAPGPPSGAKATSANGRQGPFPGQVIPGFSAAIDNRDGTFWAQPDNGFGAKGNSGDFLLRLYLVKPQWKTAAGGAGEITVLRHITLSDPRHKIDFPIVNESTSDRQLTGDDLDIESVQRGKDGTFWIGDEFGPFVVHVDSRGRVLSRPIGFPLGQSPQNPRLGADQPTTQASGGFEAMARSTNGRHLYPITEKGLVGDADKRRRVIAELDTRTGRYTGRTWTYRVDADLVADAQVTSHGRLLVLERDDLDGAKAVTKKVYEVRLGKNGSTTKSLVVDLLDIADPRGISTGGGWGTGEQFSFGFQSVETLVPLSHGRLLIANDNNYPGNAARYPGTPDDTEMIVIDPGSRTRR
ncbi:esterase-like activity of phytase family protein [Aeromicrobium stalagmiti]|uniref:esterase-like activity of phytase family protein n=1 Tax=Aeromicrobium stalagmiti TaxID=2738988 RepID=UPI0015681B3C|nr:esterase-like activity of phytase family protein [Aeromicrobium stalagmiti]NRQ50196.1 esterase-like activity of phytase family protein [Aeromicrobium stalagmiti]